MYKNLSASNNFQAVSIRDKSRKDPWTKEEPLWTFAAGIFSQTKTNSLPIFSVLEFFSFLLPFSVKSLVFLFLKHLQPSACSYWLPFAFSLWVPTAPEVMLFVWGSGVVPISVKKALLSLIQTRTKTQSSSPLPQSGQPPSLNRTLSSFCQEVNEQTPKGEGGAPTNNDMHDSHCMTPMGGSWLVDVGGTRHGGYSAI